MVKNVLVTMLTIALLSSDNAMFGMEDNREDRFLELPEDSTDMSDRAASLRWRDCDVSGLVLEEGSFRSSLSHEDFKKARVAEAQSECLSRYRNPEDLSRLMVKNDNKFEVLVALVYLQYGADLNLALEIILQRAQAVIAAEGEPDESFRSWVTFLLMHGGGIPLQYNQLILNTFNAGMTSDIALCQTDEGVLAALDHKFKEYNSHILTIDALRIKIEKEVQGLFLIAAGQDRKAVIEKILAFFGHLISDDLMQAGFTNAAHARNIEILKIFFEHNRQRIDALRAWGKTLSDALLYTAIRNALESPHDQSSLLLDFFLDRPTNEYYYFNLHKVKEEIAKLESADNIPSEVAEKYREIHQRLENLVNDFSLRRGPSDSERGNLAVSIYDTSGRPIFGYEFDREGDSPNLSCVSPGLSSSTDVSLGIPRRFTFGSGEDSSLLATGHLPRSPQVTVTPSSPSTPRQRSRATTQRSRLNLNKIKSALSRRRLTSPKDEEKDEEKEK